MPPSRYNTPYNTTHPYGYKATSLLGSFRHLRFGALIVRSFCLVDDSSHSYILTQLCQSNSSQRVYIHDFVTITVAGCLIRAIRAKYLPSYYYGITNPVLWDRIRSGIVSP